MPGEALPRAVEVPVRVFEEVHLGDAEVFRGLAGLLFPDLDGLGGRMDEAADVARGHVDYDDGGARNDVFSDAAAAADDVIVGVGRKDKYFFHG